ncbi:DUF6346 domain-containing protein [Amycolatopsis sp. lyj-112]|uniref:DUF6346 domain-containing protein n=1 Tax=Amycolatopsis sp. lyj-112 TaxID=2789288 RepID=UPI00397E2D7A
MKVAARPLVACAAAWFLLVLVVIGVMTLLRLSGAPITTDGYDSVGAEASATVTECERHGPLSGFGAGYYWECAAEVKPSAGDRTRLIEFSSDELTPADNGKTVLVKYADREWQRNVAHPYLFMRPIVPMAIALLGAIGYVIGYKTVLSWFVPLMRRETRSSQAAMRSVDLPVDLKLPVPEGGNRPGMFAAFAVLTAAALAFLGLAGAMAIAAFRLMPGNWPVYVVALPFALLGAWMLKAIPSARRRVRTAHGATNIPARLTSRGFVQTARDGSPRRIHWSKIERFVFVERSDALVEVHLAVVNEEAADGLAEPFRAPSEHGYLLTPFLPLQEAEHLSAVVENFKPGLTRWPTREVTRGGLGLLRPVKSTVVRLRRKAGTTTQVDTRVSSSRPSAFRVLLMLTACVLVIWSLSIGASGGTSMNLFIISALMVVYLAVSVYRGRRGTFVVRGDSLAWRETGKNEVFVDLASIDGIVVKPSTPGNGRWYYALHVRPRAGDEYQLVDKVGRPAVKRVLRAAGHDLVLET